MAGVLSFAHLKEGSAKSAPENDCKQDLANGGPGVVDSVKSSSRAEFDAYSLIMASKFCYGCLRFSVDAPETEDVVGWCQRDMEDETGNKYFEFRMIPVQAIAKQCPLVKSGEIILYK